MTTAKAIGWVAGIGAIVLVGTLVWQGIARRGGGTGPGHGFAKKWELAPGGPIIGSLAMDEDGTVYAPSEDGFLYALEGASGKLQWKFNAGPMTAAPAIGPDGTIYITNNEEKIFAISHDGTQQWAFGGGPFADKDMGQIAAALDENYLYTPWRAGLHAMRLTNGVSDWAAGVGFKKVGSVSVLPNGAVVYSGVGRLDAVYENGKTVWQYPVMDPPMTVDMIMRTNGRIPPGNFWLESAIAVGLDGTLYACGTDSRLVALSWSGTYKWEFKTKTRTINRASPLIGVDGTIYFGSGDGTLYALNPDGTQKWAVETGVPIVATPVLAADGTIYVVNGNTLLAVSPEGQALEKSAINGAGESSPTLAQDGTIYIASPGGMVTAFAGTHGALGNSAWPKFQGDLANRGRARTF